MAHVMPRFVIAKYIPDLSRNEPKNIGVFCWIPGFIESRFLNVEEVPFIRDRKNYQRWIRFWMSKIEGDVVRPVRGPSVSKNDPDCIKALVSTQEGQYQIYDYGELLQPVGKRGLSKVTESLFGELVAPISSKTQEQAKFTVKCDRFLESAGFTNLEEFKKNYEFECHVFGPTITRAVRFDYGVGNGNGRTTGVLQRVTLGNEFSAGRSIVLLSQAAETLKNPKRCAAVVDSSMIHNEQARADFELLNSVCHVVDLARTETALEFLEVAKTPVTVAG